MARLYVISCCVSRIRRFNKKCFSNSDVLKVLIERRAKTNEEGNWRNRAHLNQPLIVISEESRGEEEQTGSLGCLRAE